MKITRNEKSIFVKSSYNPDLPSSAKNLGGKWDPNNKYWIFDIRDEEKVSSLYRKIYGEWDNNDNAAPDAVTIRVKFNKTDFSSRSGIFLAGRQVAYATGRDSGAKLGAGVILIEGRVYSGGSTKYWETIVESDTIVEIKDVPLCKVKEIEANSLYTISIISDIDKNFLLDEKERLLKRIAEIDSLLNK